MACGSAASCCRRVSVLTLFALLSGSNAAAQPAIEDFVREADFRQAVISPDGRHLAEVWNVPGDNLRVVRILDISGDEPRVVGTLADPIARPNWVTWANDSRLLVSLLIPFNTRAVRRDAEREEDFDVREYFQFERMIAINVNTSEPAVLLEDQRRLQYNVSLSRISHYLPDDPEHVLMTADYKGRYALYKVNVYTGASEIAVKGNSRTFDFIVDRDGAPLYRLDYRSFRKRLYIYENRDGDWKRIDVIDLDDDDTGELPNDGDLVGLMGPNLVYAQVNARTGFRELVVYDHLARKSELLAADPEHDILYPISDARTNQVLAYAIDGDVVRRRYIDPDEQAYYDRIAAHVGDYFFDIPSASAVSGKAVVRVYGQNDPRSWFLYDRNTDTMDFLQASYFGLPMNQLATPFRVTYKARDGLAIPSFGLFPPDMEDGKRYPLVILPHGGPQARDRADFDEFAQFIATRGYIVLKPNFRGSTGYGRQFQEAGYKEWGGAMQDDLADAVDFLVRKGYVDADRVCIVGLSYGGYAALMGPVRHPDTYRCSVSINGVTDLREQIRDFGRRIDNDTLIQKLLYRRIGHPEDDRQILMEHSPLFNADAINIPVLIIAGDEDETVDYAQSKDMVRALEKADKAVEFIRLEDTGHNPFYYSEDMRTVYAAVERFLARHLGSGGSAAAAPAAP